MASHRPSSPSSSPPLPSPPPPPPAPSPPPGPRLRAIVHLPICALAIFASLVAYGVLQERIMTRPYFPPGRAPRAEKGVAAARRGLRGRHFFNRLMRGKRIGVEPHGNGGVVRGMNGGGDGGEGVEAGEVGVGDGEGGGYGETLGSVDEYVLAGFGEEGGDGEVRNEEGEEGASGVEDLRVRNETEALHEAVHEGEQEDEEDTEVETEELDDEGHAHGSVADDATDGALFQSSLFLVLANRIVAVLITLVIIAFRRQYRRDLFPVAPLWCYVVISLSNAIATSCQYEALKWLTFPTLTVGKCAKMLPVMLLQNIRTGKRYTRSDFAVAASVAAGAAIMIVAGNVSADPTASVPADDAFGFVLLAGYLLFDAITSTYQEHLFSRYTMSVYNQMLFINLSTGILSTVYLAASGQLFDSLAFLRVYPHAVSDVAALSVAAVAGQFAISHTIHAFGALVYAAIMTARQFCSVLVSDLLFEHGMGPMQWFGACVVFSALFARVGVRAKGKGERKTAEGGRSRGKYTGLGKMIPDERNAVGVKD